jgi:hypothetical protein
MTSNNADWEKGWFYLRNDDAGLPLYTGKVLMAKTDAWHHGVSPSSLQERLESLTDALRSLAGAGLGAASILANLHHRQIIPLMEREFHIFEMSDAANPTSLARSRLLQDCLLPEYAATRARRAVSLKSVPHNNDDLWSFVMLPDALVVTAPPSLFQILVLCWCGPRRLSTAESDHARRAVGPANARGSVGCPRRAAVGTGAGCAGEGEKALAAEAPGAVW